MTLLPVHIIAGLIAIVAGYISVFALKGAKLHRKSGIVFVYSMLVLAVTGAVMAALKNQPANVTGGSLTFYLVSTALLTVRHLWRMCLALFIAAGSFFLGQAQVFPKPIRILPLLAIPALLPLVLLLYWMIRVLFTQWYRRRANDSILPWPFLK